VSQPVAVVTDTTPYLPAELLDRWDLQQVSLYVGWEGDLHPEDSYEDLDAFYTRLHESSRLPTTSQPSVGDFTACYQPFVEDGRDVVSIHIAASLSGTCESGREAARALADAGHPGRIEVIDGETGAGGLACLVAVAVEQAQHGADLAGVVDAVRRARESLDIWFCLDTLEFLHRGGRIGGAQALLGTALQIREITLVVRLHTRRRGFDRMVQYLHELHDRGATDWVVQHAQLPEDAERLVAEGRAIFGTAPLLCTEVGPVLGAHLGSGMLVGGMTRPPV
jgi:DegV family protein with EDD domain